MLKECQIWISMNECGDWIVTSDGSTEAAEQLASDMGGNSCRTVSIMVSMQSPVDPDAKVAATVNVPDEAETAVTASV